MPVNKKYLLTEIFKKFWKRNWFDVVKFCNEWMLDDINCHLTYVDDKCILQDLKRINMSQLLGRENVFPWKQFSKLNTSLHKEYQEKALHK